MSKVNNLILVLWHIYKFLQFSLKERYKLHVYSNINVSLFYFYYYYATFNAPCIGHKDDESRAQDFAPRLPVVVIPLDGPRWGTLRPHSPLLRSNYVHWATISGPGEFQTTAPETAKSLAPRTVRVSVGRQVAGCPQIRGAVGWIGSARGVGQCHRRHLGAWILVLRLLQIPSKEHRPA